MPATTIDEVIFELDGIIATECAVNSCMAYFPFYTEKLPSASKKEF